MDIENIKYLILFFFMIPTEDCTKSELAIFKVVNAALNVKKTSTFQNWQTYYQAAFDPRTKPTNPRTVTTIPPTNIHIDLSVAEPVKNREISELDES